MKTFNKAIAFTKTASLWGFIFSAFVGGIYLYGYTAGASTITYQAPEIKQVELVKEVEKEQVSSVMERIADCESGDKGRAGTGTHMKNGKLVVNKNSNGSFDVGKYQINVSVWGLEAMKMDLNLTQEEDNKKFAYWLYDQFGTEPWVHTKKCWSK